ncbi:MAG: hypothetical protein WC292_04050 [Clostridia bacterium]
MKKKILISLFIILLSLAVVMTAVACNGDTDKPDPKKPDNGQEEPDPPTTKTVELVTFVNGLVDGVDNLILDVADITDKAYVDLTVFFKYNDTEAEVRIAGTFDEDVVDNNTALLSVAVNDRVYAQLYTEKGVLYLGQTITRDSDTVSWTKLSADTESKALQKELAKLPSEIVEMELDISLRDEIDDSIISALALLEGLLFEITTSDMDFDLEKGKGGVVTAELQIHQLSALLAMPGIGDTINGMLEDIEEYKDIVDMVFDIIFNATLDELTEGFEEEDKYFPEIQIIVGLSDNVRLNQLGLSYKNEQFGENRDEYVEVAFGIKDIVINKKSDTDLAPEGALDAEDTVIKLTVDLEIPGKDIDGYVEAFVFPDFKVSLDEDDDIVIDLSAISGYALVYVLEDGEYVLLEDFSADFNINEFSENQVRINLADFYALVGGEVDGAAGYFFDFDLDAFFNGEDDDDNDPENAEGNPVDDLVAAVEDDDFDPVAFLTGNMGLLTTVLDAITASVDEAINDAGRLEVFTLLAAIASNDIFAESDELAEYIEYFVDEDAIIEGLEDLFDTSIDEILAEIVKYTGFDADEDDLLALEIGVSGGVVDGKGLGAGVEIYSGDTLVGRVAVYFDIVSGVEKNPSHLNKAIDFADAGDLDTEEGRDAIVEALKVIRDAYIAK